MRVSVKVGTPPYVSKEDDFLAASPIEGDDGEITEGDAAVVLTVRGRDAFIHAAHIHQVGDGGMTVPGAPAVHHYVDRRGSHKAPPGGKGGALSRSERGRHLPVG